jgi:hypothetical protein
MSQGDPKIIVVLHLTPAPGNWRTPPEQRLRGALKCLLRAFGLRCVACAEQTDSTRPGAKEEAP